MKPLIGIDLGTTNTVIAYINEEGSPEIIPNRRGDRLTPSVVAFTKDKELIIGQIAKNQSVINPGNTISSIKRKMGKDVKVELGDKLYTPEEISSIILKKVKEDTENFLGEEIKDAIITVPAYFNDSQRNATIQAAKIAGLNVDRVINEPTAAALAYGFRKDSEDEILLIADFGGGTYDVTVLEAGGGVFEVLATAGNNHLGGDDIDDILVDKVVKRFKEENDIDLREDPMALQRIYDAAVKTKIELSEASKSTLSVPFITADEDGPKNLEVKFTRREFENMIEEILNKLEEPFYQAVDDAGIMIEDIDKVILVGGSTRIPAVGKKFEDLIGKEPYKNINPDECVADGAAVQSGIINNRVSNNENITLVDVTPFTLGIEIENGKFAPIIERNTTIPISKSKIFTTISDYQETVNIKVYQGENELVKDNHFLGNFELQGIEPAPKGDPEIEVAFTIDQNGVLTAKAEDLKTENDVEIEIKNMPSLSDEEVEEIIEENKKLQKEKEKEKEIILSKAKDLIKELNEEKVETDSEEKSADIENFIKDVEFSIENEDIEMLKELLETSETILNGDFDEVL